MKTASDFIVIGGGIAGMSAAHSLAPSGSVVLLEREAQLAMHTTGRSAAMFTENYGGHVNQMLTTASRAFLECQADGLADSDLLTRVGMLDVGGSESRNEFLATVEGSKGSTTSLEFVDESQVLSIVPCIRPGVVDGGVWEPDAAELDVMGLHQAFVRGARSEGARIERNSAVVGLSRDARTWTVTTTDGEWSAPVVVIAAGAWSDVVAGLAGIDGLGLQPLRRTAFTVGTDFDTSEWPFVSFQHTGNHCYFKPEAGGQLLCSPADETLSEPCDARPEEIDVARAIDSLNSLTSLAIRSVRSSWAGLRTFAPDRGPVIGWDDQADGICWMAGQGGAGIQTAPAAGAVVASIVTESAFPKRLSDLGLRREDLAPRSG